MSLAFNSSWGRVKVHYSVRNHSMKNGVVVVPLRSRACLLLLTKSISLQFLVKKTHWWMPACMIGCFMLLVATYTAHVRACVFIIMNRP
jgi:hypothetical protein